MTLDTLIMLLGVFVAVLPFLGVPNNWDSVLLLIAGVIIIMLGITVRRRMNHKSPRSNPEPPRTFAENASLDATHEAQ